MERPEKSIEKVNLTKIKNPILKELIESKLITEEGIRIQGIGIVIRKLEKLWDVIDKTNLKLHHIEKKLER